MKRLEVVMPLAERKDQGRKKIRRRRETRIWWTGRDQPIL